MPWEIIESVDGNLSRLHSFDILGLTRFLARLILNKNITLNIVGIAHSWVHNCDKTFKMRCKPVKKLKKTWKKGKVDRRYCLTVLKHLLKKSFKNDPNR